MRLWIKMDFWPWSQKCRCKRVSAHALFFALRILLSCWCLKLFCYVLHYCMDLLSNPLNSPFMSDAKKKSQIFFCIYLLSRSYFGHTGKNRVLLIFNFGASVLEQNDSLIFFLSDFILQHYNGHAKSSMHFFTKLTLNPRKILSNKNSLEKNLKCYLNKISPQM